MAKFHSSLVTLTCSITCRVFAWCWYQDFRVFFTGFLCVFHCCYSDSLPMTCRASCSYWGYDWNNEQNHINILRGSFSSAWTATIARVGAFCSIFRDLQDLLTFAPLRSQNFSSEMPEISEIAENFIRHGSLFQSCPYPIDRAASTWSSPRGWGSMQWRASNPTLQRLCTEHWNTHAGARSLVRTRLKNIE